jgi:hypothetical protein
MLEKNPTKRADIGEIFTTIKLYTCDNKTIYSLKELLKVKEDLNKEKDSDIEKYSCKKCDTYLTNKK